MKAKLLLEYRKDPRFIAAVSFLIFLTTTIVYYLIQQASELSPEALNNRMVLFALWNVNLMLILGILFVLIRTIIKLFIERHRGIHGSRFRTKLVLTYMVTSAVPIVLVFIVANDLLRVSVDRWFSLPVEKVLENSEAIAQESHNEAIVRARMAALEIGASMKGRPVDEVLRHVHRYHDVQVVGLYEEGLVVRLIADPRSPIHQVRDPSIRFFNEVVAKGTAEKIDLVPDGKWIRVATTIEKDTRIALAGVFIPKRVNQLIDESIIAHRNFQQLESQRPSLKASQTSLFMTVTLYILFGTLWVAIFVSRRITIPVKALAEGTRTLAQGDYAHRIEVKATDEFGVLIDSFNRMAQQLESQREALTQSNEELQQVNRRLDDEREYFSTILTSVSTGIVAFGEALEVLSINPAALIMLQIEPPAPGAKLDEVLRDDLSPLAEAIMEIREGDLRPREVTLIRGGDLRYLEVVGARLGETATGRGWVVAIEDTTQLVQAQKLAAWSEAARRIAHEIKNPLTPIQLSAERIAKRSAAGDSDLGPIVVEGTRTIIDEVTHLKEMVDEFSRFARMPAIHLQQTNLAHIIDDIARLYADAKPGVTVVTETESELEAVLDPEQIRRALINLLDNAFAATSAGEIVISAERRGRSVRLTVTDPGRGVPDDDKEKLFLPYFSTKKGEGTGLGLAIVHRIVHDHDGRITVHDNLPRGTRFEIELPG